MNIITMSFYFYSNLKLYLNNKKIHNKNDYC